MRGCAANGARIVLMVMVAGAKDAGGGIEVGGGPSTAHPDSITTTTIHSINPAMAYTSIVGPGRDGVRIYRRCRRSGRPRIRRNP